MIEWNDFAKRRKLNLEDFKEWSYEDYTQWCVSRYVTPVSEESFSAVKTIVEPIVETASVPITIDEKRLKKMKKSAIIELCEVRGIDLDGHETKANLISMILNNSE